jgi:hypothetical protein
MKPLVLMTGLLIWAAAGVWAGAGGDLADPDVRGYWRFDGGPGAGLREAVTEQRCQQDGDE